MLTYFCKVYVKLRFSSLSWGGVPPPQTPLPFFFSCEFTLFSSIFRVNLYNCEFFLGVMEGNRKQETGNRKRWKMDRINHCGLHSVQRYIIIYLFSIEELQTRSKWLQWSIVSFVALQRMDTCVCFCRFATKDSPKRFDFHHFYKWFCRYIC